MSQIDREGNFRGRIVEMCVGKTQASGLPRFEADLQATEYYDEETEQWVDWSSFDECEIRAFLTLVSKDKKPTFHTENLSSALGWDGVSYIELDDMDVSDILVQFRVVPNTYEKSNFDFEVSHIVHADADPSRSLRRLDRDELKALEAKFANALNKPKPKSAPAKPKATPKTTKEKAKDEPQAEPKTEPKRRGRPPKSKTSKPPKPPEKEAPKKGEPAGVETLGLPETCTEDEAWAAFKKYIPEMDNDAREKVWFAVIKECGDVDTVDKNGTWATVRDILLEQHSDQIVTA